MSSRDGRPMIWNSDYIYDSLAFYLYFCAVLQNMMSSLKASAAAAAAASSSELNRVREGMYCLHFTARLIETGRGDKSRTPIEFGPLHADGVTCFVAGFIHDQPPTKEHKMRLDFC